jgi:hypothetical protein
MSYNIMAAEKKPTPPPRKKKALNTKIDQKLSANSVTPSQQQIDEIISQAFTRFYTASLNKQSKIRDLQNLDVVVAEFLQTFMILGYDINGEKVCITHASTPAARDALVEHLRCTFLSIMNGGE